MVADWDAGAVSATATEDPSTTEEVSDHDAAWWMVAYLAIAAGSLLRLWGLGSQDLTFDEAFTGAGAHKPLGQIPEFLRTSDTHPPLDYFVRHAFAATGSELLLRLPSVVFSIALLVLLAVWLRRQGPFGALTVMVASVLPFMVLHGREARMYSGVMFFGLVVSAASERWLDRPRTTLAVVAGAAGFLALMSHSATVPAVAAFVLLPGLRRDRQAWIFRGAIVAAFAAWAVTWGPAFREQSAEVSSFWIPRTTVDWFQTVVAALVSQRSALLHVSSTALILGLVALLARRGSLARVAACALVAPLVGIALGGLKYHILLPRSFAFGAWVVAAALAAAIDWFRSTAGVRGSALGIVLVFALLSTAIVRSPLVASESPHLVQVVDALVVRRPPLVLASRMR